MSYAHVHAWEATPMAWIRHGDQWVAVYRCLACAARDARPVPGPEGLPAADAEFAADVAFVLAENAELYRRLAQ